MTGSPLPDGRYDAFVVEVEEIDGATGTVARLEVVVTSGPHKGEVVAVMAAGLAGSVAELIGLPAMLVVEGGQPAVTLEG